MFANYYFCGIIFNMSTPHSITDNSPLLLTVREQVEFARTQTSTGAVRVGINERDELVVPAFTEGEIYTAGLCGCTAVAATLKFEDDSHRLYMQHYNPRSSSRGLEALVSYLGVAGEDEGLVDARVVIMHPGNPGIPEEISDARTYWLLGAAEHILEGPRAEVQRYPYDAKRTFRIAGAGTLKATVNSSGESAVIADLQPLPRSRCT